MIIFVFMKDLLQNKNRGIYMKKSVIKVITIIFLLIAFDQSIKLYMLIKKPQTNLIYDVLSFSYVENTGSAFGIASGNLLTIMVSNVIILVVIIKFMINQFDRMDRLTKLMLCIVIAGGLSNLSDRIFHGFVVDYIKVNLLSFPIFNLADIYIVVGWIMLIFLTVKYTLKMKKTKNLLQEGGKI